MKEEEEEEKKSTHSIERKNQNQTCFHFFFLSFWFFSFYSIESKLFTSSYIYTYIVHHGFTNSKFGNSFRYQLWPIFDYVVSKISNNRFIPSEFEFVNGVTPLSTFREAAAIIAIYYTVIFGGRAVIRALNLPVIKLNGIFQIHNLF